AAVRPAQLTTLVFFDRRDGERAANPVDRKLQRRTAIRGSDSVQRRLDRSHISGEITAAATNRSADRVVPPRVGWGGAAGAASGDEFADALPRHIPLPASSLTNAVGFCLRDGHACGSGHRVDELAT